MTAVCLSGALREAVEEVLECMFFMQIDGPAGESGEAEELAAAQVDFEGSPSGTMRLRMSWGTACRVAADFLGEEESETPPERTIDVMREFVNMICGAVLSRVESGSTFRLSAPVAGIESGEVACLPAEGVCCHVALPGGRLSVQLECGVLVG